MKIVLRPPYKLFKILQGKVIGIGFKHFGKLSYIKRPIRIIGRRYISFGEKVYVCDGLRMEAISAWLEEKYNPMINIGDEVNIGQYCHITCANKVSIGNGVSILPNVLITDIEHEHVSNVSLRFTGLNVGSVEIGDYSVIGMGARILGQGHLKIGRNVIVGANSLVTSDIPDNVLVAGIPAKIIKYLI